MSEIVQVDRYSVEVIEVAEQGPPGSLLMPVEAAPNIPSLRTLGSGMNQAAPGDSVADPGDLTLIFDNGLI